eukprot:TRINITY_DN2270_c0_g1_i1.p1 TRINITY_DN2270_c0_g1~~TRINITY_DN2270_c0_g1_i1.p1  ORF type:complete len:251 (-),score=49.66 TRINITY_DN2270_c0_g1_i1:119-871(-)
MKGTKSKDKEPHPPSSNNPLLITDKFVYTSLKASDVDELAQVIGTSFFDEPASSSIQSFKADVPKRRKFWLDFTQGFVEEAVALHTEHLTIVCKDLKSGKIVGGLINRDFNQPFPESVSSISFPDLRPISTLGGQVDETYRKLRPDSQKLGDTIDFWMAGTLPEYRRNSIESTCVKLSLDVARNNNFKYAVAELTGFYSVIAFLKNGFYPMAMVDYRTFEYEGKLPFSEIPMPHVGMVLGEVDLSFNKRS